MTCPICNDEHMIPDSDGEGRGMINCFICSETMGGTELQNYLYGLGLSVHLVAKMADVQDRTVRRWVDDYWPVPYDVHLMILDLEKTVVNCIQGYRHGYELISITKNDKWLIKTVQRRAEEFERALKQIQKPYKSKGD